MIKRNICDSVTKAHPGTYKINYLNGEKMIRSFYGKELILSKL